MRNSQSAASPSPSLYYLYYRVSGLSCPEAGGCKSAILRGFPDVFSLFGPFKVGEISFRYSWTTGMKKKFRNLIPKKGQISGLVQIDILSDFLVLGVANFRINYLRQFSFNFENSCAQPMADLDRQVRGRICVLAMLLGCGWIMVMLMLMIRSGIWWDVGDVTAHCRGAAIVWFAGPSQLDELIAALWLLLLFRLNWLCGLKSVFVIDKHFSFLHYSQFKI